MKTKIIRNTRVGLSNVAAVFAQKTTTWAISMAQDDQKDRLELLKNGLEAQKAFDQYLKDNQLKEADVDNYFAKLADTYGICLK